MQQYRRGLWGSFLVAGAAYLSASAGGGCAGGNELAGGGGGTSLGSGGQSSSTTESTSSSSTIVSSGSSATGSANGGFGGTGGSGGTGGTAGSGGTGQGGSGGTTSASTAASTSASSGSGGAPAHHLVVLAAGSAGAFGAAFDDGTSTWTPTALSGGSNDRVGLAFDGNGTACGAIKSPSDGAVDFVLWSAGSWNSFAQLGADVTFTGPLMTGGNGTIDLTFQGVIMPTTRHYFFARRDSTWATTAEPVSFAGNDSFGFDAAAVTRLGADTVIAYAGDNHDLYDQTRSGGAWAQSNGHALGNAGISLAPAIVPLTGQASDLMIVFVRTDAGNQIQFTKRTNSSWSAPLAINVNALTDEPPSLAALANGDLALVFRGQNGLGYFSVWTGAPRAWTVPAQISAASIPSPPAVAPGGSGADAEIVYVDGASGGAVHARVNGVSVTTASIGGSGLTHAAIASQ